MIEACDPREIRGCAIIAKGDEPKQLADNLFKVPSQNGNGDYIVKLETDISHCTCPDHKYRNIECKHIHAVKLWKALQYKLEEDEIEEKPKIVCKFCGSSETIKYGKKNGKQNYLCKTCKRRFVDNGDFQNLKFSPHIISLTLDLYFKGVSLRKITDHLKQFYGLNMSHVTIYNWIEKYVTILNDYVSNLEPELSDVWHADEMKVKLGGGWDWLWNVMDEGTRFQLASVISKRRREHEAIIAFKTARKISNRQPKTIVTDGLRQYGRAIGREFNSKSDEVEHIRNVGLRSKVNNNLIERLHGTMRERNKVQRGLKTEETPIIDGQRIYYNFLRPHQGLEGKTPAEAAGIDLGLEENRWLGLLEIAIKNKKYEV